MQGDPVPSKTKLLLQRAGLSIPGAGQLLNGQPLSDPADRVVLAWLVASAPSPSAAHPPSLPPPVPPTPLPGVGPVMLGSGVVGRQRSGGTPDSIWLDLGFPVGAGSRGPVRKAGMSCTGVEELFGARALSSARDRALLASWISGGGDSTQARHR